MTLAPEEENGLEFTKRAVEAGIHVSIGHTAADYDTALAAFQAGADHVTHLFNGMPPIHHRAPGVIMAAFDSPGVRPEIICDGVHIHGSVIRGTFRLFGADRMILISDSLRATGMPDGKYPFGGQMIAVHGNRATILDHPETLAGSVTSLMAACAGRWHSEFRLMTRSARHPTTRQYRSVWKTGSEVLMPERMERQYCWIRKIFLFGGLSLRENV